MQRLVRTKGDEGKIMLKKILAISLSLIMIFLSGCSNVENENIESKENKPLVENINNINIIIDPRIELLSVIIYLSPTYNSRTNSLIPQDLTYKKDVEKWFGKYKDHEAVKLFESMSQKAYTYNAPPTTMLYLTNTPHLTIRDDIDTNDLDYKQCIKRAGGKRKFKKFVKALNSFCEESNFYDFYNNHIEYYERVIDSPKEIMKNINDVSLIESYYGTKQNSYNIIFSGMLYENNYGPRVENSDGKYDIYYIKGSYSACNDLPNWGQEDSYKNLIRHEFGHSFINNLTSKNITEVNKYEKLFDPIENIMGKQGYPEWETCVNEHLVRAVVIRINAINKGESTVNNAIKIEKNNGFIYI